MSESKLKSKFLQTLFEREQIHQCSNLDALDHLAATQRITAYIGFDCTAPSLHVGHLLSIMLLYRLQQCGHHPIVLLGGGTSLIGDPSGKTEARPIMDTETINSNKEGIKKVFSRFLHSDPPNPVRFLDNAEWLTNLQTIPFLRDYGKHFSVNSMIKLDSVHNRLENQERLSFLEFNYMILQAYDFLELYTRHGCVLQMGGSDQWGNITCGINLARRKDNTQLFALTTPLLTTPSGAKMGKTAAGAVWLDADMLSPFDYWQYWHNCHDEQIRPLFLALTNLSLEAVDRIAAMPPNHAKKQLAHMLTALAHGEEEADRAAEAAGNVFIHKIDNPNLPTFTMPRLPLGLLDTMRECGLASSNGEARRAVDAGGVRLNNKPIADPTYTLEEKDFDPDVALLTLGKKRVMRLVLKP